MPDLRNIAGSALRIATGNQGTFSPDNFRKQFSNGVGRPNLFQFKFKRMPNVMADPNYGLTPFQSLGLISKGASVLGIGSAPLLTGINTVETMFNSITGRETRDLTFRVSKAQLPQKIINTYNVSYYGPGSRFPSEIDNSSITIDVISSGSYWEHIFFTGWQNSIIDYDRYRDNPSFDVVYFDDIVTEAELIIYNDDGEKAYTILFEKVWPEVVGGDNFDWSRKDSIVTFPVTLHYSVASNSAGSKSPIKGITSIAQRLINLPKF